MKKISSRSVPPYHAKTRKNFVTYEPVTRLRRLFKPRYAVQFKTLHNSQSTGELANVKNLHTNNNFVHTNREFS